MVALPLADISEDVGGRVRGEIFANTTLGSGFLRGGTLVTGTILRGLT